MQQINKIKCHSKLDLESSTLAVSQRPQQALKMLNQVQHDGSFYTRGFTLIELLVVVLIIGILAAVAMPQYQRAVEKARLATLIPLVKSIANAKVEHQLATGEYARTFEVLSVELPPQFVIQDEAYYGQIARWRQKKMNIALDSGSHSVAGMLQLSDYSIVWFYIGLDNQQSCLAEGGVGTRADSLCKSLPGATFRSLSHGVNPVYNVQL